MQRQGGQNAGRSASRGSRAQTMSASQRAELESYSAMAAVEMQSMEIDDIIMRS